MSRILKHTCRVKFCGQAMIDHKGSFSDGNFVIPKEIRRIAIGDIDYMCFASRILSKRHIDVGRDKKYSYWEDYGVIRDILISGSKIRFINEVLGEKL